MIAGTAQSPRNAFVHQAFFYESPQEYAAVAADFVAEGIAAGEEVLVAVPTDRLSVLSEALPAARPRVQLVDMSQLGRNPARIIPLWRDFVSRSARSGRAMRGIGEPVWVGRSGAELAECQWHEALLNLAFADAPAFSLMCPYDSAGLDPGVLEAARRSHPFTFDAGSVASSDAFAGVPRPDDDFDAPLDPPPAWAATRNFGAGGLAGVRRLVFEQATMAGLSAHRAADLILAVNEAATNSVRHGGGHGTVSAWSDVDAFVCDVHDDGRIRQALVGRQLSPATATGGRGLWLVHQLCDLVQVRSGSRGTTVRMSISAPVRP